MLQIKIEHNLKVLRTEERLPQYGEKPYDLSFYEITRRSKLSKIDTRQL